MLLKVLSLSLCLAAVSAAQCGQAAITPRRSGVQNLMDVLTGKTDGRIVGGVEATAHSWPWQIALYHGGSRFICGGSILNNEWVVSAAHCCALSSVASQFSVRIGAHNLRETEASVKVHTASKIIQHPSYSSWPSTNNDFCLLKLATPIEYNDNVSPVCLADGNDGPAGKLCYVTGWGNQEGGRPTHILRQADVSIVTNADCNTAWGGIITPQQVCIADPGKGSCHGDSGGPLVCQNDDGLYKLVGIVSWGSGTCGSRPGVYARTSTALEWIANSIAAN